MEFGKSNCMFNIFHLHFTTYVHFTAALRALRFVQNMASRSESPKRRWVATAEASKFHEDIQAESLSHALED